MRNILLATQIVFGPMLILLAFRAPRNAPGRTGFVQDVVLDSFVILGCLATLIGVGGLYNLRGW